MRLWISHQRAAASRRRALPWVGAGPGTVTMLAAAMLTACSSGTSSTVQQAVYKVSDSAESVGGGAGTETGFKAQGSSKWYKFLSDFETTYECAHNSAGWIRGRLVGRVWTNDHQPPPPDIPLAHATVELRYQPDGDTTAQAMRVRDTQTDAFGAFEFKDVPSLVHPVLVRVVDSRIAGGYVDYLRGSTAELFGRCIVPQKDLMVRLFTLDVPPP